MDAGKRNKPKEQQTPEHQTRVTHATAGDLSRNRAAAHNSTRQKNKFRHMNIRYKSSRHTSAGT
jgi:hypothetical protein